MPLSYLLLVLVMLLSALNLMSLTTENEMPAHYSVTNWPDGLKIDKLDIYLQSGRAEVKLKDGATLKPYIPLDQLARFLNDHVQGRVENIAIKGGKGHEDKMLQLLDEVTVPGRLHVDILLFIDFFHFPWAGIERILDGRTLRAKTIGFIRQQLPSDVDANELFMLPAIPECSNLALNFNPPQLPGLPPRFDNAALMEWLEQKDGRRLLLDSDCLSSGPLSFLDALKKNFQQATQVHSYGVKILCPSINGVNGGLRVQDEKLFNRLGEKMVIKVVANHTATEKMGHPFKALQVLRVLPR